MRIRTGLKAGMVSTEVTVCGRPLLVEVAQSKSEQAQGLMYRQHLSADAGMLFTFRNPQQVAFYMANTAIPLDVGFFTADGVLREVRNLTPFSSHIITSSRNDIQYALEVTRGWFVQHCGL